MCILGLLLDTNEQYPFILIDNRDENPDRPAEQTITLDKDTGVLCARDLFGGGTWCGYNTLTGSIAVLTNVNDDPYRGRHRRIRRSSHLGHDRDAMNVSVQVNGNVGGGGKGENLVHNMMMGHMGDSGGDDDNNSVVDGENDTDDGNAISIAHNSCFRQRFENSGVENVTSATAKNHSGHHNQ